MTGAMAWALIAPALAKDDALQMVAVDGEGGGGTLFVTPDGKSLLIDTGNPEQSRVTGDHPSYERIVNAAHALGVTCIDHGITRETTASPNPDAPQIDMKTPPPNSTEAGYQRYMAAIAGHHHI